MMSQNLVLSCLSGTSRDGLDIGLCRILQIHTISETPRFRIELLKTATVAFPPEISMNLSEICFSKSAGILGAMRAHAVLGNFIGDALGKFIHQHRLEPQELLCIASHGQTLYHQAAEQPRGIPALTLQIGEADIISRKTGVPVAADFRQAHIAAGGEGAPLAPILDYYAYRPEPAASRSVRVLINLGGIANVTLLSPGAPLSKLIYGDTGPANIMMDQAMQRLAPDSGTTYDAGGELARKGRVHQKLFECLKAHAFFAQPLPKSTGPEVFHLDWALSAAEGAGIPRHELSLENLLATFSELSAFTLASAIQQALPDEATFEVFGSGGGMHNHNLTRRIGHYLGLANALPGIEQLGGSADFKEVALFALLGYFRQKRFSIPLFEGKQPVLLGKLSET